MSVPAAETGVGHAVGEDLVIGAGEGGDVAVGGGSRSERAG